jgi:circadian clock protein KaiB
MESRKDDLYLLVSSRGRKSEGFMKKKKTRFATAAYEKALKENKKKRYLLKLYVAGATVRSTDAIANIKKLCKEELPNQCDLQVIDIYQQPKLAKGEQIIATPTLVKKLPAPLRKVIGDFSNLEDVLVGLDIKRKS